MKEAVEALAAALDSLAAVDLADEDDRALLDAAVRLQQLADRQAAQQLRVLEQVDRREAHLLDAAVTTASWLRHRARLDHGAASRQVDAARRLRRLPRLRAALDAGEVTLAHVTEVTRAAVPRRMDAVAAAEDTLVELALAAPPRDVRLVLRHLADAVDADGSDATELSPCGPDERRHLDGWVGIDRLVELRAVLDQTDGEALLTALDAAEAPDPADTPAHLRRSPGQRRADALGVIARHYLDTGHGPTVHGVKPHLLVTVDLATILGRDDLAARTPRLRHTGAITGDLARHLALDAKVTAILTMGPWRVVNVGRTMRTLPPWLRIALELVHRHCRGPHCDRPAAWTEAHHQLAWDDGGDTDLSTTIPLCKAHHDLVTTGRWHATLNPDTAVCTWTAIDGTTIRTHPPPP
jgi:hypothetical protein